MSIWSSIKKTFVESAVASASIQGAGYRSNFVNSPYTEATFRSGPGVDPDEHLWESLNSAQGLAGRRNLPRQSQKQMIDYAYYLFRSNPLAKRSVELTAQYAIGPGIQYEAADEQVREILDAHWTNPVNDWSIKQYERIRDLGLIGELCIPATVNPGNGSVTLGHIEPGLIDEVVADPDNPMKSYAVIIQKLPGETIRRAYKIIDVSNATAGDTVGRLVGLPETDEEAKEWGFPFKRMDKVEGRIKKGTATSRQGAVWWGSCFFTAVNKPLSATRGVSDLLAQMDWLDTHDQLLFSTVEKAVQSANHVWDVTLEGMNQTQINKWLQEQPTIRPGQRFAHNEKVSMLTHAPDLHLEDVTTLSNTIKNNILSGAGKPPIWFAESMTARASAPEQTEPAYKDISTRQRYFASLLTLIFRYQIDQAFIAHRLRGDSRLNDASQAKVESTAFYLKMPEVSSKDQRALAVSINSMAQALRNAIGTSSKPMMDADGNPIEGAQEDSFITRAEAARIFRRYLETNGLDAWKDEPKAVRQSPEEEELSASNVFRRVQEANPTLSDFERGVLLLKTKEHYHGGSVYFVTGSMFSERVGDSPYAARNGFAKVTAPVVES